MKHVDVHDLWLQEIVKRGRVKIQKIPRSVNSADLLASPSKADEIAKVMEELGFTFRS